MAKVTSIAALENALVQKRQQVSELQTQRSGLLRQIATLDKQIAALAGTPSDGSETPAAQPLPMYAKSLMACVIEVLSTAKDPMTAGEIADAVTAMGYVSASKDLKTLIWGQVYRDDRVTKSGRGKFVLVGESKTGEKK